MKVLMRTLGQPVNPERLKEVLNESRAKDVRHKIELDFFSLVAQLDSLVEDPFTDNEVRRAFSSLESNLGVNKGLYLFKLTVFLHLLHVRRRVSFSSGQ